MTRTALINIDTQQSFEHRDFWQTTDLQPFQAAMLALINGCRQRDTPIVDIFHAAPGGPFAPENGYVRPMSFLDHHPDATFIKHVHNAFTDTGLDRWLRGRDINHLIICGMRTEQCCETTARVASDLGYQVTFVTEATLTFPMIHKGITLDVETLRHRTETVLAGRFAAIKTVSQTLEDL